MARDWKAKIIALRVGAEADVTAATRQILIEASGGAMSLREARSRLFILSVAAGQGKPQVIDLAGSYLVIVSVDDFAAVICEPTLDEFLDFSSHLHDRVGHLLLELKDVALCIR